MIVVAIMITGAVSKTNLSAFVGTMCSLVANFRKSARAWKKPGIGTKFRGILYCERDLLQRA